MVSQYSRTTPFADAAESPAARSSLVLTFDLAMPGVFLQSRFGGLHGLPGSHRPVSFILTEFVSPRTDPRAGTRQAGERYPTPAAHRRPQSKAFWLIEIPDPSSAFAKVATHPHRLTSKIIEPDPSRVNWSPNSAMEYSYLRNGGGLGRAWLAFHDGEGPWLCPPEPRAEPAGSGGCPPGPRPTLGACSPGVKQGRRVPPRKAQAPSRLVRPAIGKWAPIR